MGSIPAILVIIFIKKHTQSKVTFLKLKKKKNNFAIIPKTQFFFKNTITFRSYNFFKNNYTSSTQKLNFINMKLTKCKLNKHIIYFLLFLVQNNTSYITRVNNLVGGICSMQP